MKNKELLKKILCNLEEIIASIFLIITTGLVVVNVFMRYVMDSGLYWSEEVATICFVWSVFLGAAAAYKRGKHIGVDILINKLPKGIRNVVVILVDILLIVLNGYITYLAIVYVSMSYVKPTPVLGISSMYVSLALVIAFALMTVYSIVFIVRDYKKMRKVNEEYTDNVTV